MFNMKKAKSILATVVTSSFIITSTIYAAGTTEDTATAPVTVEEVTTLPIDTLLAPPLETPAFLQTVKSEDKIVYLEFTTTGTSNTLYHLWSDTVNNYIPGQVVKAKAVLSNGWYQLLNGEYVSNEFVKVRSDLGTALFVRVSVDALNIRTTPSIEGEPNGGVYKGELLEVYAVTEEGWYQLSQEKFINGKYVELLNVTPAEFKKLKEEREAAIKAEKERLAKLAAEKRAKEEAARRAQATASNQATAKPVSTQTTQTASKGTGAYASIRLTAAERELLARLIYCEANVEPFAGQVGVAQVIFNRVLDGRFPNSVSGVIYAKNQFVPVTNGKINRIKPTAQNYQAIDAALASSNLNGAVYFHDPRYSGGSWWNSLTTVASIGHHAFKK